MNNVLAVLTVIIPLTLFSPTAGECQRMIARDAHAQDDWKTEFETVCARTQEAAGMSAGELKTLVDRCDKLRPQIDQLDESQKKVYLKRLKMCRDLYAFVLETKEKK